MHIYEKVAPNKIDTQVKMVALKVHMANNDSPARQKLTGIPGQRSEEYFCICFTRRSDINTMKGYEIERK
jgi:hypothetical protein